MTFKTMTAALALSTALPLAAQAADPVKIGVIADRSSSCSDITGKGAVVAARLAVADCGGKARGRDIELLSAAHQNKADLASSIARKWHDEEGVTLISGLGTTAAAVAVRSPANAAPSPSPPARPRPC